MRICIAGFCIHIQEGKYRLSVEGLPCHYKFLSTLEQPSSADVLSLRFAEDPTEIPNRPANPLCQNEIWELWFDEAGNYVFTQPAQAPQRWVLIKPDFTEGVIYGDFSALAGAPFYPLEYLDIVLYSNWLALRGDLILHASGVILRDEAVIFLGNSGAGKSTLAADLKTAHNLTILGEDQIILRKIGGAFIAFGTPWHEAPERCDSRGAPLGKLFFLDRAAKQTLTPLDGFEASVRIMTTAFIPYYLPARVQAILDTLSSLPAQARAFLLSYQRGSDVLELIHSA